MKSTAKKTTKSPAPATPARKTAPAPAPKITRVPRVKSSAASAASSAPTVIEAHIDVGFGNTLYLRGDGPGLSWNKGIALDCRDDELWVIALRGVVRPVSYKLLVNDLTWSKGADYTVTPGSTSSLVPTF